MNEVATFFRDRQKDPGETYQLTLEGWKGTHLVSVYSQKPIESNALKDRTVATQQDYDVAIKDLRNAITGNGGGVIVVATDEGRWRTFCVECVNAKPNTAAECYVALSPGRPTAIQDIEGVKNRGYKCAAGSYALVPVNHDAQQRLLDFVGHLSWLSPDLESLVLHAIRRPSLDRRLDRVETRLFNQTTEQALGGSKQGLLERIKSWMVRSVPAPVMRVVTAVLLVVLIAMQGIALYRSFPKSSRANVLAALNIQKKPAAAPNVVDARALLKALQETEKPLLRTINEKHFASLAGDRVDEEIYKAFTDDRAVLWGLVKLELLAIKPDDQPTDFVTADDEKLTISAYDNIPPNSVSNDARQFLAAVGCKIQDQPPLPFDAKDCDQLSRDTFEKGLQRLTKFVEKKP